MTQTLRPDSTIDNTGNFLPYNAGSLHNALGDNSSFIYQNDVGTKSCIVGLQDGAAPGAGDVKIEWFAVRTAASEKDVWQTMALYEGATLIATSPETQITSSAYTWYEYILTAGEVAAITDWTDLRGQITHRIAAGDGAVSLRLAQFKITAPDAPLGETLEVQSVTHEHTAGSVALTMTSTLEVDGVPGATVFEANFDDGTLNYFDGSRADIFGKNNGLWDISVAASPAIGAYSAGITLPVGDDDNEGLAGYLFVYTTTTGAVSHHYASFYFPSTMRHPYLSAWWYNFWQHKSVNTDYNKPIIMLGMAIYDGVEQITMANWTNGLGANPAIGRTQTTPIAFPRDQWVEIHTEFYSVNDFTGYCICYQDGVEILRIENIQTRPNNQPVLWSVNSYTNPVTEEFTIYVDDMILTEDGTGVDGHVTQGHTSENVVLTDGTNPDLIVQDSTHGHTSEAVTLFSTLSLSVDGITHGHTSEDVSLVMEGDLSVQDVTHGHSSEGVILGATLVLMAEDSSHHHTSEGITLTMVSTLDVQDVSHEHVSANVVLSIVGTTPVSRIYRTMRENRLHEILPEPRQVGVRGENRKEVA